MKPKFLIEDDAFPEDVQSFIDAVISLGFEYKAIKQTPLEKPEFLHLFDPKDCVVFYGSLGLAKKIRRQTEWIPGAYYDVPKYDCTNYYPPIGKHLVQENYIMLPFGELKRQKEFLYDKLGSNRAIFVRPNRGDKIFTGQVVLKENYEKEIELFAFGQVAENELVVVAEPRNLKYEWRFVVVEGKVVSGSQYRENDLVGYDSNYPKEALDFAEMIAALYCPEPAFVVDVCLTKQDEFKVMEIGCFSCAGLYLCDRKKIIEAVAQTALKEWNDIWN